MTFLNPFVLFGLAAAAIPIILHLIHLRKLRTIEFSTVSFLKELQKTKIRRLKLRQLLLLILRTLLVLLIVLAFARPTLKGTFAGGSRALTTAVLILDDSNSMTAADEDGEYFRQAKDAALGIVNLLEEGDEIYVIPLSASSDEGTRDQAAIRDLAVVRALLKDLQVTSVHRRLDDALRLAARLVSGSRKFNKEVYVISDFQAGIVTPHRTRDQEPADRFEPGVKFFFLPIGKGNIGNFGIASSTIPNSIIEAGKPFTLDLAVGNFSEADARNHLVSVFLNGSRVAQKGLDIPAGQIVHSEFSLVPRTNGFIDGMIELEDDDLPFDNRFYFSLLLPERIRILLVGTDADTRYLSLALAARAGESSMLTVDRVTSDRVTPAILSNQEVVFLTNAGQETATLVEHIAAFVSGGGGLLLFPGPKTSPAAFNKLYARLRLPNLSQIEAKPPGQSVAAFARIEQVELRHPLFEGMFERENSRSAGHDRRSLEAPEIRTLARFVPTATALSVMTLSNGAPFFLDQRSGSGRILIACVPATLEWSDFPLKGLFVPLIHRSISYLTQEQVQQQAAFIGDPLRLTLPDSRRAQLAVQTPHGIEASAVRDPAAAASPVVFTETEYPGLYTVKENLVPVAKFAINIDPDESKTSRADEELIQAMMARVGIAANEVTTIDRPGRADRVVLESRFGVELWKHLLIAALAIAIVEMIIARDSKSDSA